MTVIYYKVKCGGGKLGENFLSISEEEMKQNVIYVFLGELCSNKKYSTGCTYTNIGRYVIKINFYLVLYRLCIPNCGTKAIK
jgi:hypothetical protein